jgi:hypothetical protein
MRDPAGEANGGTLRIDFDRRLRLQFCGAVITSDAGLLAYRELDDTLALTDTLADARTGKNGQHQLVGLLRQSVFGRVAGYEDVNDAEWLRRDPAMRWVVAGRALMGQAAQPDGPLRARHGFEREPDLWRAGRQRLHRPLRCPARWTRLSCRTFAANAVRLQLHALAYNLGNFMRTLAMPKAVEPWSLTSLREKLIKIGAKVVSHGRYVTFQMAEVAVSRLMFRDILMLIARLRAPPAPA